MELYSNTNPQEATPIQKAKLAGIAKTGVHVDLGTEHLRGSESDQALFISVGREDAKATDLIRIAKPGSYDFVETGAQKAAELGAYNSPITREVARLAIDLSREK